MAEQYTNVTFAPQYANETNEQRYARLLNEFRNKSTARFALLAESTPQQALQYHERVAAYMRQNDTDKITNLYNAITFCWNRSLYKKQKQLLIEIVARLNIACDEPHNMQNLQQLGLLTQEIPNKELYWHMLKYCMAPIIAVGVALAILIPCASLPALAVVGIALAISLIGAAVATYELGQIGFKTGLRRTQKEINDISFFAPGIPKESEAPLDTELHSLTSATCGA